MSSDTHTIRSKIFTAISAVSFPLYLALILAFSLFNIGQLADLAFAAEQSFAKLVMYGLSAFYFNFMIWWSCRQTLDFCTYYDNSLRKFAYFSVYIPTPGSGDEKKPKDYYGGSFGFYAPRIIPLVFFSIVIVFALLKGAHRVALATIIVALIMTVILSFRRRLYAHHKTKTVFVQRWFWHLVVFLLIVIPSYFAISETLAFSRFMGGLAIVFLGLGGLVSGATWFVHTILIPVWNNLFLLLDNSEQNWRKNTAHFFYIKPPYPVAFAFVASAVLISIFRPTDNHAFHLCDDRPTCTVTADETPEDKKESSTRRFDNLDKAFSAFVANTSLATVKIDESEIEIVPVIFVANQGGGLRASYWSNAILSQFEGAFPGFSNNVFLMSGASGGTVGNFAYLGAVSSKPSVDSCNELPESDRTIVGLSSKINPLPYCLTKHVHSEDHLSAVVTSFLYNDLLYRFVQMDSWKADRAHFLERSFVDAFNRVYQSDMGSYFELGYQNFYRAAIDESNWQPIVIGTTAIQELGLLATVVPYEFKSAELPMVLDLQKLQAYHRAKEQEFNRQFDELSWIEWIKSKFVGFEPVINHQELTLDDQLDVPIITTAINSARFPYVTPTGTFYADTKWSRKLHTADAGYLDNFGAITIQHSLQRLASRFLTLETYRNAKRVYVPIIMVLKNSPNDGLLTDYSPPSEEEEETESFKVPIEQSSIVLNEILAPLQAFMSGRGGHAEKRLTELLAYHNDTFGGDRLACLIRQAGHNNSLIKKFSENQTLIFSFKNQDKNDDALQPPLGWYLSESAQTTLDRSATNLFNKTGSSFVSLLNGELKAEHQQILNCSKE